MFCSILQVLEFQVNLTIFCRYKYLQNKILETIIFANLRAPFERVFLLF